MEISISTPDNFNFKSTALSHGWYDLPPFSYDESTSTLNRVLEIGSGRAVSVRISQCDASTLNIVTSQKLGRQAIEQISHDVRHMLRFDDDLTDFYKLVNRDDNFMWISKFGAGRLLRAPTVFEDLIKMICTTNCSWSLTDKMVNALVEALGNKTSDGQYAFPTPAAMASQSISFYQTEVRAGYRAPYLSELAYRVASRELDVEGWLSSELPVAELKREMLKVKGVGPYAAENMLRLVGRYDGLALDSWVRGKFARTHNRGRAASDRKIERHYARFGAWKGLALWCDMTRDWHES
jgi:N-glycosylase/DNA lyase